MKYPPSKNGSVNPAQRRAETDSASYMEEAKDYAMTAIFHLSMFINMEIYLELDEAQRAIKDAKKRYSHSLHLAGATLEEFLEEYIEEAKT